MRARLNIAAIFIAVGLGALTVILVYDPGALIPRPPYYPWIFVVFSLAALGTLFVLGLEDDLLENDDTNGSGDQPIHWLTIGLAFLTSALACAVFIGATALVGYLDRALA